MVDERQNKASKSPGRNDPCPCGSGKKYKKCCGQNDAKSSSGTLGNGDLNSGFALYNEGDIEAALSIASRLVHANPNMPEAYVLTGMCRFSQGKFNEAKAALLQVEALAEYLQDKTSASRNKLMLAALEQELGNYENAERYARAAINLGLRDSLSNNALGSALVAQEKFKEAKIAFQRSVGFDPTDAELWENLGICNYSLFEFKEAVRCFKKAINLNPNSVSVHKHIAMAYMELYSYEEAIKHFLLFPENVEEDAFVASNLGAAYSNLGKMDEAYNWLTRSINLDASQASTFLAFGIYYQKMGDNESCKKMLHKVIAKEPESVFFLTKILAIFEESCMFKEREEILSRFRKIENLNSREMEYLISTLLRLNYTNTLSSNELYKLHSLAGEYLLKNITSTKDKRDIAAYTENRKIRIGYVSTDFRHHSVGYFIRNIIGFHDPNEFEVYCYADIEKPDAITDEIRSRASKFIETTSLSDEPFAEQIYNDRINILVDLNGYTGRQAVAPFRLPVFAYKPAPIQITYLGYPNTTGMNAIDYRLTDRLAECVDGTHYSEELLHMPECFLCFGNFLSQNIDPVPAFEKNGYITFGSFNNAAKLNTEVIGVWSEILNRVEDSVILIKSQWLDQEITKENILLEFETNGVDRKRVRLQRFLDEKEDHLSLYNKIDIGLDTFPYNGATTTCEALWMGVPVITLLGKKHAQRVSYSILKNIGHEELVAESEKEYVDTASELALNLSSLRKLKKEITVDLENSILCNPARFTKQLEEIYKDVWNREVKENQ